MRKWDEIEIEGLTWELSDFHDINGRLSVVLIVDGYVFVAKCKIEGHLLCQKDFEDRPFDVEIIPWDDEIEKNFDEWVHEEVYIKARSV